MELEVMRPPSASRNLKKIQTYRLTPSKIDSTDEPAIYIFKDGFAYEKVPAYGLYTFLRLELDLVCQENKLPETLEIPAVISDNPKYRSDELERFISAFYGIPIRSDIRPAFHSDMTVTDSIRSAVFRITYNPSFIKYYIGEIDV